MRRYGSILLKPAVLLGAAALLACPGCGKPKITYTGLKLVRPQIDRVTKADVNNAIRQLRSNFATASPLSPGTRARKGHRAVIDFVGTIGGTPFQGGSHSGFPVVLGAGQMIPGFEEGLTGMRPGETRDIEAQFPENYHEPALAGRTAVFRTTLRMVESLELPPLDADLARRASGGRISTVAELRKATQEQIYQNRVAQADRSLRMQAAELANRWAGKPLPVTATCYDGERLYVRLAGAQTAVSQAVTDIGGEPIENGDAFWRDKIREHGHAFFAGDVPLWRLSVPQSAPPVELPGKQLIEWGGAQRWLRSDAGAELIRAAVQRAGGHASLFRGRTGNSAGAPEATRNCFELLPAAPG